MSKCLDAGSDEMAEVLRLSTAPLGYVLITLLAEEPVPPHLTIALINDAYLLRDNDLPWPPVLAQALHELADRASPT